MCGMLQKVSTCRCIHVRLKFAGYYAHPNYKLPGFRKKVAALSKQKDCQLVRQWERSLINHLYWCVVSTSDGNGEVIKAKWLSVDNHIHNVHSGHSKLFRKCSHGKLKGRERQKKWFKRSKYFCILQLVTI